MKLYDKTSTRLRIKEICQREAVSMRRLADALAIPISNLSDYNSGKISPTIETVSYIANFLGVTFDELIERPVLEWDIIADLPGRIQRTIDDRRNFDLSAEDRLSQSSALLLVMDGSS